MISGASEEELIEAIGRADVLLEFMPKIKQLQQENKKLKEVFDRQNYLLTEQGAKLKELYSEIDKLQGRIDKAIEFSNKNWGTWCSNHLGYMTELQNILKEVSE